MSDDVVREVLEAVKAKFQSIDPYPYPPPGLFYISPDDEEFTLSRIVAPDEPPVCIIDGSLTRRRAGIKRINQAEYRRRMSVVVMIIMDTQPKDEELLPYRTVEDIARQWFPEIERVMLSDPFLGGTVVSWGNPNDQEDDLDSYIGRLYWPESTKDASQAWWGIEVVIPVEIELEFAESYTP